MAALAQASEQACVETAEAYARGEIQLHERLSEGMAREVFVFEPMIRSFIRICALESGTPPSRKIISEMVVYRSRHRLSDFDLERCRILALDRLAMWPGNAPV